MILMQGYIHSTESFGTVDGPGIRFVVFFQGCPMRCLYCHNPDTWEPRVGTMVTVDQLLTQYQKNKSFYKNGGITVTGGEPLLQIDFLTELFEAAKAEGIHTCLDSSGVTFSPDDPRFDRLMAVTDLVMLDIKHIDPEKHRQLTGHDNRRILAFAKYLEEKHVPLWVRHIIVEGYTDDPTDLTELGRFIGSLSNLKALDVLPYHTMGVSKYKSLGISYPLEGVPALTVSDAVKAKAHIMEGIRQVKTKKQSD